MTAASRIAAMVAWQKLQRQRQQQLQRLSCDSLWI